MIIFFTLSKIKITSIKINKFYFIYIPIISFFNIFNFANLLFNLNNFIKVSKLLMVDSKKPIEH